MKKTLINKKTGKKIVIKKRTQKKKPSYPRYT